MSRVCRKIEGGGGGGGGYGGDTSHYFCKATGGKPLVEEQCSI